MPQKQAYICALREIFKSYPHFLRNTSHQNYLTINRDRIYIFQKLIGITKCILIVPINYGKMISGFMNASFLGITIIYMKISHLLLSLIPASNLIMSN